MSLDHDIVGPVASMKTSRSSSTLLSRLRRDRLAIAGLVTIVVFVLVAIFAPFLSSLSGNDPYTYHLDALDSSGAPAGWGGGISAAHWFGVEPLTGRDLFSIVVYGSRTSLVVGLGATFLAMLLGTVVGLVAGYFGGWVDTVASRIIDVMFGFPSLIFMIALGAIVPVSFPRLVLLVVIIGFFGWASIARVVRGQTLALRKQGYVRASTALGASHGHILFRQILPNLSATIVVFSTITIPATIGSEAALSFLGVGVAPPTPSWGRSIGDAVTWFSVTPMYLVFPGVALFLITLAFNVFGDGLRDALDPRSRGVRS
ncbi:peptide/nickel transport system permease protein [Sanguibacter gelidistatuariae]|uniref:Peptide/nickel transport system permease protein n=1 Tax=Sanguibacter gelidistatuariae TaxID=1814289 RepID=A0A1G6NC01_9MICO|nr:ABC transporter permease [Sanguibacter gelidistatuariae]SDC65343.1 peptide/nickel transport system permease protein [Sanguibacter gelidistatuariae]